MKRTITAIATIIAACSIAMAQTIKVGVIDTTASEPIPFATIVVEYRDTLTGGMADTDGIFSFVPRSLPLNLKVSGFGMKENSISISTMRIAL